MTKWYQGLGRCEKCYQLYELSDSWIEWKCNECFTYSEYLMYVLGVKKLYTFIKTF